MRQSFITHPVIIGQTWTALLTVQNFAKAPRLIEAMSQDNYDNVQQAPISGSLA